MLTRSGRAWCLCDKDAVRKWATGYVGVYRTKWERPLSGMLVFLV